MDPLNKMGIKIRFPTDKALLWVIQYNKIPGEKVESEEAKLMTDRKHQESHRCFQSQATDVRCVDCIPVIVHG